MDLAQQYADKVRHHLQVLQELEQEYDGRFKSSIYLEKRRHNKNAIEHWKNKLYRLGKESTIISVQFTKRFEISKGLSQYKRYETLLIGVNQSIAEQIILMDFPEAYDFTFQIIQPGVLKEI